MPTGNKEGSLTPKTIYDPCPNGYRIPKDGTYGNVNDWTLLDWTAGDLTNGHLFKTSFFSASGNRSDSDGMFDNSSAGGFGWMSTPGSYTYGYCFGTSASHLISNITYQRSASFNVRCIAE